VLRKIEWENEKCKGSDFLDNTCGLSYLSRRKRDKGLTILLNLGKRKSNSTAPARLWQNLFASPKVDDWT